MGSLPLIQPFAYNVTRSETISWIALPNLFAWGCFPPGYYRGSETTFTSGPSRSSLIALSQNSDGLAPSYHG